MGRTCHSHILYSLLSSFILLSNHHGHHLSSSALLHTSSTATLPIATYSPPYPFIMQQSRLPSSTTPKPMPLLSSTHPSIAPPPLSQTQSRSRGALHVRFYIIAQSIYHMGIFNTNHESLDLYNMISNFRDPDVHL